METFKFITLFIFLFLISCDRKKEDFDLTFYKWNIQGDYYLKFNSSDTVYLIIDNPIEKQTGYRLLDKNEKDKLTSFLSKLNFPVKEEFSNNVDDGLSYAFVYKNMVKKHKLYIHAKAGPNEFWNFGDFLQQIKDGKNYIPIAKTFDLNDIRKMVSVPPPPNFKVNAR